MANENFDLGLALCRLRDSITSVEGKYFRYVTKNKLDIKDEENIYVKRLFELELMTGNLYKCKTEEDAQALINRIDELRKFIDEVK